MNNIKYRTQCRLCGSNELEKVIQLNSIPLSEKYNTVKKLAKDVAKYPLTVSVCNDCAHVQQIDIITDDELWRDYSYFTGKAKGMKEHLEHISKLIKGEINSKKRNFIVDIGSNDGTLLKNFSTGNTVLGIDPAVAPAKKANEEGIETLISILDKNLVEEIIKNKGKADLICMFNAFAHVDDLDSILFCIDKLLAKDGLFVFEAQYLLDIIDGMLISTMFHEHMSHHSLIPLVKFFNKYNFEIVDVIRDRVQHGAIIGFVKRKDNSNIINERVNNLLIEETKRKLNQVNTIKEFGVKIKSLQIKSFDFFKELIKEGNISAFGASRSGPSLIAQFGLTDKIKFIYDDEITKIGKYTAGDGILIKNPEEIYKDMPNYIVILAWVHNERIMNKYAQYMKRGGKFIVLCPNFTIHDSNGSVNILEN
jgi:SAM-dependent methyltransferase